MPKHVGVFACVLYQEVHLLEYVLIEIPVFSLLFYHADIRTVLPGHCSTHFLVLLYVCLTFRHRVSSL